MGAKLLSKRKPRYVIRAFVDMGTRVRVILIRWGVCGQRSRGDFREVVSGVARATVVTGEGQQHVEGRLGAGVAGQPCLRPSVCVHRHLGSNVMGKAHVLGTT